MNTVLAMLLQILANSYFQDTNYQIAYYLVAHYQEIPRLSNTSLAQVCHVSGVRLSRFVKDLGFQDLSDFKRACLMSLEITLHQMDYRFSNYDYKKIGNVLFQLSNAQNFEEFYQRETLKKILDKMRQADRVIVVGSISMASLFQDFQTFFSFFGIPVYINTVKSRQSLLKLKKTDLVCICSMTGRIVRLQPELLQTIEEAGAESFLISKECLPGYLQLHIYSEHEIFEANHFVRYYLDCLRHLYYLEEFGHAD